MRPAWSPPAGRRADPPRLRVPALLLALALLLAGCQASSAGGTAGGGSAPAGRIYLTKDLGIWTMDPSGGNLRQLIAPVPNSLMRQPALSPDGKLVAYALLSGSGKSGLPNGDIYFASADGSKPRKVVKHDVDGSAVQDPAWAADGKTLYFTYIGPLDKEKPLEGFRIEIQRLPLEGGAVQTVIGDGSSPSLSRDGRWLAYLAPSPQTKEVLLHVSGPDGSDARALTKEGDFLLVAAPKVSPDGRQIVFAAAGAPPDFSKVRPTPSSRHPLQNLLGVGVAEADGAPMDIWSIGIDGTGLKRLTNLAEDSPYPAWSADGKHIAFLGIGGLYVMNADGTGLKKVSDAVSHGEIDWRPD